MRRLVNGLPQRDILPGQRALCVCSIVATVRISRTRHLLGVCWQAPNQLRVQAYQVVAVCDGHQLLRRIKDEATRDFDGQIVVREAPAQLSLRELWEEDEILSLAFRQGLAGYPLQLDLLLSETPLAALMEEDVQRTLLEPAKLDGTTCHRVQVDNVRRYVRAMG